MNVKDVNSTLYRRAAQIGVSRDPEVFVRLPDGRVLETSRIVNGPNGLVEAIYIEVKEIIG